MAFALILPTARIRLQPAVAQHPQSILSKLRPKLPRRTLAQNLQAQLLASQQQKMTLYETLQTSFALLDRMLRRKACLDRRARGSRSPYPAEMFTPNKQRARGSHCPRKYRSRFQPRRSPWHLSLKGRQKCLGEPRQSYKPANPLLAIVTQPLIWRNSFVQVPEVAKWIAINNLHGLLLERN